MKTEKRLSPSSVLVFWHPSRVLISFLLPTGGLRYATTTGYFLTAFQAEKTLAIPMRSSISPLQGDESMTASFTQGVTLGWNYSTPST
jgi:hypothetical protein